MIGPGAIAKLLQAGRWWAVVLSVATFVSMGAPGCGQDGSQPETERAQQGIVPTAISAGSAEINSAEATEKAIGHETTINAAEYIGGHRAALIIGNNTYRDPGMNLTLCEKDARDLYDILVDPEIGAVAPENATLLVGSDATKSRIMQELDRLSTLPANATIFIYYSGHGANKRLGKRPMTYWVTHDTDVKNLIGTAIRRTDVQDLLAALASDRVICIFDCCFAAGLVEDSGEKGLEEFGEDLARFTGKGRAVFSAAGPEESAIEASDLNRSVFTHYVIEGLEGAADTNEDGIVVVTELETYVSEHVADEARRRGGHQSPHIELDGVREAARFHLTIDADRLRRLKRETEEMRQLRAERIEALDRMYLDGKIDRTRRMLGERLLAADEPELDQYDRKRLARFVAVFNGELTPETLQVALAVIRPPGPITITVPEDHSTIQEAINAALIGDTVLVKAGEYKEALTVDKAITLRGESTTGCFVRVLDDVEQAILVTAAGAVVESLTLEGPDDESVDGLRVTSARTQIRNCVIRRFAEGLAFESEADDALAENNVLAENSIVGIQVASKEARIRDNTCSQNGVGIRFWSGSGRVEGNTCEGSEASGIAITMGSAVEVADNRCRVNGIHGLIFEDGAMGSADGNTCTENGWSGITVWKKGSEVAVVQNACRSNKHNGILFGNGAGGAAKNNTCEENALSGIAVLLKGSSATIAGNTCRANDQHGIVLAYGAAGQASGNSCKDNTWCGIAVADAGTDATIHDNTCESNAASGIAFVTGAKGAAEDNRCSENKVCGILVTDAGTAPTLARNNCRSNGQYGIYFGKGADGLAESNSCEHNRLSGIAVFHEGSEPLIRDNTCRSNERHGIRLSDGCSVTAQGNACEYNSESGIYFDTGTLGTAERNTCEANKNCGIAVFHEGTEATLRDNTCRSNVQHGIFFGIGADGLAEGNTCERNQWSGITAAGQGTRPAIQANRCRDNRGWGINVFDGATPKLGSDNTVLGNSSGQITR